MIPSVRVAAMNAKHMALTTITLVAVIATATLVKVGLGGRGESDKGPKQSDSVSNRTHLTVPKATIPDADPQKPIPPPYGEIGHEGHHDFWFTNDNDASVDVFLRHVSCGRCVTMQIGLAPEGWSAEQAPGPEVAWTTLESEEGKQEMPGFTVPAKAAGWLRLIWNHKDTVAEEWLGAQLRTTCSVGKAPPVEVKVMVRFLEPVRTVRPKLSLDPIRSGSDKPQTAWFQVYSVTRDSFSLEPTEQKNPNPFVTCGRPVALSETECSNLRTETHLPVRCGYKVPVTVREQAGGQQHELGPFSESVALKSDALDENVKLTVTGTVEGLVTVLCGETKDQIALGAFPRITGTQRIVMIETATPGTNVTLTIDDVPEFLNVSPPKLESSRDGRKRWRLDVSVKTAELEKLNVLGSLEEALRDPALYLKANGRRLRIPVTGTVLRQ
jgi:hypothetical protein